MENNVNFQYISAFTRKLHEDSYFIAEFDKCYQLIKTFRFEEVFACALAASCDFLDLRVGTLNL